MINRPCKPESCEGFENLSPELQGGSVAAVCKNVE
jgi:hypothetical protein